MTEEITGATPEPNSVGSDAFVCVLVAQPQFNGVGARCAECLPEKGRCSIRIHFGGRVLLVKPSCVEKDPQTPQPNHDDSVTFHGAATPGHPSQISKHRHHVDDAECVDAINACILKNPEVCR